MADATLDPRRPSNASSNGMESALIYSNPSLSQETDEPAQRSLTGWMSSSPSTDTSSIDHSHDDEPEEEASRSDDRSMASTENPIADSPVASVEVTDKRGNPAACIFVASLTKDKNDEELNLSVSNHFAQWGQLLNVKVLKDWMGRPYAFVQYEKTLDAKRALRDAPGTLLDDRRIRCEPARVNRTLCVSVADHPLSKKELVVELSVYGQIEDLTLVPPRGCQHCAYVKFRYRDDAIRAFLTLRNPQAAQKWCVEWASNLDTEASLVTYSRKDKTSIFIGNLPDTTTEGVLYARFKHYGNLVHMRIIRKPNQHGHRHVFAFVKYSHENEAANAIHHENNNVWGDHSLRVAYRERHDMPHFFRGRERSRTYASERPHPPGVGYPASIYPYLALPSRTTQNDGLETSTPSTTTEGSTVSTTPAKLGKMATTRFVPDAAPFSPTSSIPSASASMPQHDSLGHTVSTCSSMVTSLRSNSHHFHPRSILANVPTYTIPGPYFDVCASMMTPADEATNTNGNAAKFEDTKNGKSGEGMATGFIVSHPAMYDYYYGGFVPVAGYYPAPHPPPRDNYYDPYGMYPSGYICPPLPAPFHLSFVPGQSSTAHHHIVPAKPGAAKVDVSGKRQCTSGDEPL